MPNFSTLDTFELNHTITQVVASQDAIVFDGYSLQNSSFITRSIGYDDLGKIELNTFNFPRNDGGGVLSKYYRGRTITLKGIIKKDTASNFNSFLDEIKKNLKKTEGYLEITVNGEVRRIKATVTSLDYNRDHYNVTFSPISIVFTALEPFFYASTSQASTFEAKAGTFTEDMTHNGTADSEPTVYFLFWAGTAVSEIVFADPTGKQLDIVQSLLPNDILVIDTVNKIVTLNNNQIDYSGVFPKFTSGGNNFTVTFTGTVLVDVTVVLPKNYL